MAEDPRKRREADERDDFFDTEYSHTCRLDSVPPLMWRALFRTFLVEPSTGDRAPNLGLGWCRSQCDFPDCNLRACGARSRYYRKCSCSRWPYYAPDY
jgi:hypothetical protein